jgi:hypothetical protein
MGSWWRKFTATTRTWMTSICAIFQGHSPAACMRSSQSEGLRSSGAGTGERKHELAEPHVPKDPTFSGLFLVITGNAPAPLWEVKRNTAGQFTETRHRKNWPFLKHYYFHIRSSSTASRGHAAAKPIHPAPGHVRLPHRWPMLCVLLAARPRSKSRSISTTSNSARNSTELSGLRRLENSERAPTCCSSLIN